MITHIQVDVEDTTEERKARIGGALDVFSSPLLAAKALAGLPETARSLIIDLRDVAFVDSAGVSALVKLHHEAATRAVEMRAHLGDVPTRINATVVDLLRRVVPFDD